jgi:GxxExxY protein
MNTDQTTQKAAFAGLHAEVSDIVLRCFYDVYRELGGGFLEGVYHRALAIALQDAGLSIQDEVPIPVHYRGKIVGEFKADLTVNDCVLLELKAVSGLESVHESQVLNYLRATKFEVGLLLNFGSRPHFKRLVLQNETKVLRVTPRVSAPDA